MLFVGPAKKVLKPRAAPAKKPSHGSSGSSDRKGEARPKPEPRKAPIPPTMKIYDAADNEVVVQSVAKHMESIPLESLGGAGIDPSNLPFPLPHGTKQFDVTARGEDAICQRLFFVDLFLFLFFAFDHFIPVLIRSLFLLPALFRWLCLL